MNYETMSWRSAPARDPVRNQSRRPLRMRLYASLGFLDVTVLVASFAIASGLRFGVIGLSGWTGVTVSVVALYLATAILNGAYSLEVLRDPARGFARAISAALLAFGLLFLMFFFLQVGLQFSRLMTGIALVFTALGLAVGRQWLGQLLLRHYEDDFTTDLLLMDGVTLDPPAGFTPVKVAGYSLASTGADVSSQMRFSEMVKGADRVVIACSDASAGDWAQMLKTTSVQGELLSRQFDALAPLDVSRAGTSTTLVVSSGPLNLRQRIAKRVFDLVITVPLLIALLPVLLVIALAIKLESPGPVLFRQPRVGFDNGMFSIFKFRSMRREATDVNGDRSASRDDDRVTAVGKILRRTSLDELPQFLNVLLGSMSIVGPRPHALGSLAGADYFWDVDSRYWQRHVVKPGITGLAQVRGFRGATHTRDHLKARLQADLEYLSGWTLSRDIEILARTFRVLVHPDAY